MATISGYDSSSLSVLFSSLNRSSSTGSTSGVSDLLNINYSDYATIRNGSYMKLMKTYYATDASEEVQSVVSNKNEQTTATSKDDTETLAKIEGAAEDMKASADALLDKTSDSVFAKEDTDKIYEAVNKFVSDYNTLIDKASDSETSNISGAAERLVNMSKSNEKMLNQMGITIEDGGRLKVDEETFKKADTDLVKGMFQSTGGFGYQVSAQASMINYYAENEASKANTYNSTGSYNYNYNAGSVYDLGI